MSQSTVELGTQEHPYKELDSAFVEVINFHVHSERTINIFVMEGSTVFMNSPTYIVNTTLVHLESYSEVSNVAGMARIVGVQNNTKIIPPSTPSKFNILSKNFNYFYILGSKTLLLDVKVFNNSGFAADELGKLSLNNAVFKSYFASFTIK